MTSVDQAGWNRRKRILDIADGRHLAYIATEANAPPLVLLHGYTDSSRSWSLLEPHLAGYRLVMPDLPGHGRSSVMPTPVLDGFAEDLIRLADALDIDRFAVAGHSMGAIAAITLTARHADRIQVLASISGSLRPGLLARTALGHEIRALEDPIDPESAFLREWHSCALPLDPDFAGWIAREAAAMPASVWRSLFAMLDGIDLRAVARTVRAPVLLLAGDEDVLFDAPHRAALGDAFPHAVSHVLPGHSHNPHWESPGRVAGALLSFLGHKGTG